MILHKIEYDKIIIRLLFRGLNDRLKTDESTI